MDRDIDAIERKATHQSNHTDDQWQPIELSPVEGSGLVKLLARLTLRDLRQHSTSDPEALQMLIAVGKMLLSLRQAGY